MLQAPRVDDHNSFLGGEPELAIPGAPAAGLRGRVGSLAGLHSVRGVVVNRAHRGDAPVAEAIQIPARRHVDAVRGTDPEVAVIVGKNPTGVVVEESVLFRVTGDPAVANIEAGQPGSPAAEPEAAPAVGGDGSDREVDLLLPGALGRFTLGKLEQPLYRAEPQRAGWVAVDGESVVARSGERRRLSANSERPDYAFPKTEGQRFMRRARIGRCISGCSLAV